MRTFQSLSPEISKDTTRGKYIAVRLPLALETPLRGCNVRHNSPSHGLQILDVNAICTFWHEAYTAGSNLGEQVPRGRWVPTKVLYKAETWLDIPCTNVLYPALSPSTKESEWTPRHPRCPGRPNHPPAGGTCRSLGGLEVLRGKAC